MMVAYCLMLVIMIYDVYIFSAVIAGLCTGEFLQRVRVWGVLYTYMGAEILIEFSDSNSSICSRRCVHMELQ